MSVCEGDKQGNHKRFEAKHLLGFKLSDAGHMEAGMALCLCYLCGKH